MTVFALLRDIPVKTHGLMGGECAKNALATKLLLDEAMCSLPLYICFALLYDKNSPWLLYWMLEK